MGTQSPEPAEKDVGTTSKTHAEWNQPPTTQRSKGPRLFATYRIAYLKNKLLLLKAMAWGKEGQEESKQET